MPWLKLLEISQLTEYLALFHLEGAFDVEKAITLEPFLLSDGNGDLARRLHQDASITLVTLQFQVREVDELSNHRPLT